MKKWTQERMKNWIKKNEKKNEKVSIYEKISIKEKESEKEKMHGINYRSKNQED